MTSDGPSTPGGLVLPEGFRLGIGSSAYQSEGASLVGGRGLCIWDEHAARTGTADGARGAGHYDRLDDDLDLIASTGARDYRFSFSWPRLQPDGRGELHPDGIEFYERLLDGLAARGIAATATVYHWDLPQHLEDDAGWMNRATVEAFADYAAAVADRFADRVAHWIPVNEPLVHALLGYGSGTHAPGRQLGMYFLPVAHHLLLAHGYGVQAVRAAGARSVGCANNHAPIWPVSDEPADVGACKIFDAVWNGMSLESMLFGRYPTDLLPLIDEAAEPGDLATIRQPLDFYGVTYTEPMLIGASPLEADLPFAQRKLLGHDLTDSGSPIAPEALREWLIVTRARYRAALPPIVVTGLSAGYDAPTPGVAEDPKRVAYLAAHLEAVVAAVSRGVEIDGAFVGPLLDGFEWHRGYDMSFGLVGVDPTSLDRTPKDSLRWLASLATAGP